jgi:hypothetical protein
MVYYVHYIMAYIGTLKLKVRSIDTHNEVYNKIRIITIFYSISHLSKLDYGAPRPQNLGDHHIKSFQMEWGVCDGIPA